MKKSRKRITHTRTEAKHASLLPTLPEGITITFRARGGLCDTLAKAANQKGRSISEEIEHRLQTSFDRDVFDYQAQSITRSLDRIAGELGQMRVLQRYLTDLVDPLMRIAAVAEAMQRLTVSADRITVASEKMAGINLFPNEGSDS